MESKLSQVTTENQKLAIAAEEGDLSLVENLLKQQIKCDQEEINKTFNHCVEQGLNNGEWVSVIKKVLALGVDDKSLADALRKIVSHEYSINKDRTNGLELIKLIVTTTTLNYSWGEKEISPLVELSAKCQDITITTKILMLEHLLNLIKLEAMSDRLKKDIDHVLYNCVQEASNPLFIDMQRYIIILEKLIKLGANVNFSPDRFSPSTFMKAVSSDDLNFIKLLVKHADEENRYNALEYIITFKSLEESMHKQENLSESLTALFSQLFTRPTDKRFVDLIKLIATADSVCVSGKKSPVLLAAEKKYFHIVLYLLSFVNGTKYVLHQKQLNAILFHCVSAGKDDLFTECLPIVKKLVALGASPNAPINGDKTAFQEALEANTTELVNALSEKANETERWKALFPAIESENWFVLKLVANSKNVVYEQDNLTSLPHAAKYGKLEVLDFLLGFIEKSKDPHRPTLDTNMLSITLNNVLEKCSIENLLFRSIVERLIALGADINYYAADKITNFEKMMQYGLPIRFFKSSIDKASPETKLKTLHCAACLPDKPSDYFKLLVTSFDDLLFTKKKEDDQEISVLEATAQKGNVQALLHLLNFFPVLEEGKENPSNIQKILNNTLMYYIIACIEAYHTDDCSISIVERLIELGADVNADTLKGKSIFSRFVKTTPMNPRLLKALLTGKPKLHEQQKALQSLCETGLGETDLIDLLATQEVLTAAYKAGQEPLVIAAKNNDNRRFLRRLLELVKALNIGDKAALDATLYHLIKAEVPEGRATEHKDLISQLLALGAAASQKQSDEQKTSFKIACELNQAPEILSLIAEKADPIERGLSLRQKSGENSWQWIESVALPHDLIDPIFLIRAIKAKQFSFVMTFLKGVEEQQNLLKKRIDRLITDSEVVKKDLATLKQAAEISKEKIEGCKKKIREYETDIGKCKINLEFYRESLGKLLLACASIDASQLPSSKVAKTDEETKQKLTLLWQYLLSLGADLTQADTVKAYKKTKLYYAAKQQADHYMSKEDLENLFSCQFELKGNSALHYAAQHGDESLINALLKAGADYNQMNNEERLPFEVAFDNNHPDAAAQLLSFAKKQQVEYGLVFLSLLSSTFGMQIKNKVCLPLLLRSLPDTRFYSHFLPNFSFDPENEKDVNAFANLRNTLTLIRTAEAVNAYKKSSEKQTTSSFLQLSWFSKSSIIDSSSPIELTLGDSFFDELERAVSSEENKAAKVKKIKVAVKKFAETPHPKEGETNNTKGQKAVKVLQRSHLPYDFYSRSAVLSRKQAEAEAAKAAAEAAKAAAKAAAEAEAEAAKAEDEAGNELSESFNSFFS